jgi:hypothetical protein
MMDISNVAAYSLQAGMTMQELSRFMQTLGKQPDKQELKHIAEIRRQLANTCRYLK